MGMNRLDGQGRWCCEHRKEHRLQIEHLLGRPWD